MGNGRKRAGVHVDSSPRAGDQVPQPPAAADTLPRPYSGGTPGTRTARTSSAMSGRKVCGQPPRFPPTSLSAFSARPSSTGHVNFTLSDVCSSRVCKLREIRAPAPQSVEDSTWPGLTAQILAGATAQLGAATVSRVLHSIPGNSPTRRSTAS